ncbi:hypothetical protein GUJ93_ZPchr0003g16909 [Zizania palustris]|uniref:Uncharacterized protein n=1 Tax=Zizania palustris TaxID=103762 RepID=A0A8J5VCT0_ZIZPA|nr:hypothetical protein GUJ93_ZPchr0003g16909 [Zizania palustris]
MRRPGGGGLGAVGRRERRAQVRAGGQADAARGGARMRGQTGGDMRTRRCGRRHGAGGWIWRKERGKETLALYHVRKRSNIYSKGPKGKYVQEKGPKGNSTREGKL